MNKYVDRFIQSVREEMSLGAGGGTGYKGSDKTDSGSPTAGYDPVLGFDGRKKKYNRLSKDLQDATRALKKMFGLGKLQVLESKLDIYEDLSKEMLDKLERAVTTISENSNRVDCSFGKT